MKKKEKYLTVQFKGKYNLAKVGFQACSTTELFSYVVFFTYWLNPSLFKSWWVSHKYVLFFSRSYLRLQSNHNPYSNFVGSLQSHRPRYIGRAAFLLQSNRALLRQLGLVSWVGSGPPHWLGPLLHGWYDGHVSYVCHFNLIDYWTSISYMSIKHVWA